MGQAERGGKRRRVVLPSAGDVAGRVLGARLDGGGEIVGPGRPGEQMIDEGGPGGGQRV